MWGVPRVPSAALAFTLLFLSGQAACVVQILQIWCGKELAVTKMVRPDRQEEALKQREVCARGHGLLPRFESTFD